MTKTDVVEKIMKVEDIFSFIVNVYIFLDTKSIREIRNNFKKATNSALSEEFDNIQKWAEEFSLVSLNDFKDWIDLWILDFNKTALPPEVFCYVTLQKLDDVIGEQSTSRKLILNKGPLNTDDRYRLYLKPSESYFQKTLKKGRIIRGRQTVEYDTDTLNANFYNFEVIKETQLHDYNPQITEYSHCFNDLNELKIACMPMLDKEWFVVYKNHETKEFSIEYDSALTSPHNETIKKLLIECENQKVDIALFPELAMTPTTQKYIREFLISANFKHLKLIFLGSVWENNSNVACLLTGKGTVLILEKKQIPYEPYDKDEHCNYREAIEGDHQIKFIDIPKIGRIVYLICADFNNESINTVCSVMHANFVFVSAYTNSSYLMSETARSLATRKGVSTIICNSCAPLQDVDQHIVYCLAPKVKDHQLLAEEVFRFSGCTGDKNCNMCIKTFVLSKTYT